MDNPLLLTDNKPKMSELSQEVKQYICTTELFFIIKIPVFVLAELGVRGDTVFVRKSAGRNKLLPRGLAVYPSPENKHMFEEEIKVRTLF